METKDDRAGGVRTRGLLLPKQARYQTAPQPVACDDVEGGPQGGSRTLMCRSTALLRSVARPIWRPAGMTIVAGVGGRPLMVR